MTNRDEISRRRAVKRLYEFAEREERQIAAYFYDLAKRHAETEGLAFANHNA